MLVSVGAVIQSPQHLLSAVLMQGCMQSTTIKHAEAVQQLV
jgi:hypothetical protein